MVGSKGWSAGERRGGARGISVVVGSSSGIVEVVSDWTEEGGVGVGSGVEDARDVDGAVKESVDVGLVDAVSSRLLDVQVGASRGGVITACVLVRALVSSGPPLDAVVLGHGFIPPPESLRRGRRSAPVQ